MLRAMRGLARHWGLGLLLAAAAPLLVAFTRQGGIASFGDDSVSYLVLARWMDGTAAPLVSPWVPWHAHFAPLFPLALATAGASQDLARAHLVVAVFAIVAIASVYRFALEVTGRRDAAIAVATVFMLTPTAWLSAKGILSEPLYLAVSMEALRLHARRSAGNARIVDFLAIGVALGLAYLTRSVALALLAAYGMHALLRWFRARDARAWIAFVPAIAMALAWIAVRPEVASGYAATSAAVMQAWESHFGVLVRVAPALLFGGWTSSFTGVNSFIIDESVPLPVRAALAVMGIAAIAGAVIRARANALDGWYVLASLALLLAWVFDEENMRRLLYPVLPLLLLHAGIALAAACRRAGWERHARLAAVIGAGFAIALSAPAVLGIASKARDRAPLLEGHAVSAADMTEYYRTPNIGYSRAVATRDAAVLTGFAMLSRVTPPDAKVMCVRPEYVALLGARAGVELDYAWDGRALADAVRSSGAGFIVATALSKSDLERQRGDAMAAARLASAYTRRSFVLANAQGFDEFVLLEVDREALERFAGAPR
jgi:4-amino-4-deoxy-L-arabinose transferase-like glycosyltransferase